MRCSLVTPQVLSDYFARLKMGGEDPRKTLDDALAMGLKAGENMKPNSLYVFLEQVVEVINWAAPKYEKALQFL